MELIDDRGDQWTFFPSGLALVRQVDSAACEMIRCRHTRPSKVVMSLAELERALMEQGSGMRGCLPTGYSIAGIPVEVKAPRSSEEDRYVARRFLPYPGDLPRSSSQNQFFGIDPARPGSERTVIYSGGRAGGRTFVAREIERAMAVMRNATAADDVYRRHGGRKRPPSKLHPLVKLDEAIGRDMERGDEDGREHRTV